MIASKNLPQNTGEPFPRLAEDSGSIGFGIGSRQFLTAVLSVALCCLAPGLAKAQFERDPAVVQAFERGKAAMLEEKWEEAIQAFDEAIALDDGTFAQLHFGKGEALRELEDYQNAIKSYQNALQADDSFAQAYNGRGMCWRELGDLNLALNDFQNAAGLDRRDPLIAANLGDMMVNNLRDPVQAMQYLDRAIEGNPKDVEAYRNRGAAHAMLKEYDEGRADLEKAIELDPKDYENYQTLASVHQAEENYALQVAALGKAIENYEPEESSDPDSYIDGYLQRAAALMALAKEDETNPAERKSHYQAVVADANAILDEFPDRFPESGIALYHRGTANRMQKLYAEAITSFTDAIQLVPPGSESSYIGQAYLVRGICWFYQGQNSLARGDFREAASQTLEDPLPHLWMGFTHAQEENYRRAIESYGEAAARSPALALAHVNRGLGYLQLKDYKKALDNFNEAIRVEPTEPKHFFKRGKTHELLEEWQKALDSYELALLRDPEFDAAYTAAARVLRKLGRPGLAEQYEQKAAAAAAKIK